MTTLCIVILGLTASASLATSQRILGIIGNDTENVTLERNRPARRFYLNMNAPATASGIISSLKYCFVLDADNFDEDQVFLTTVGFYRPVSLGYDLINTAVISFNGVDDLPDNDNDESTLYCDEMDIPEFEVQVGDVIGVCLREFSANDQEPSTARLNVFGVADYYDLWNSNRDPFCVRPREMPTSFSASLLGRTSDRILRVAAHILLRGNAGEVTMGTAPIANHTILVTTAPADSPLGIADNVGIIIIIVVASALALVTCLIVLPVFLCLAVKWLKKKNDKDGNLRSIAFIQGEEQDREFSVPFINADSQLSPQRTMLGSTHFNDQPSPYLGPSGYVIESLHSVNTMFSASSPPTSSVSSPPTASNTGLQTGQTQSVSNATYMELEEYAEPEDSAQVPFRQYELTNEIYPNIPSSKDYSKNVAGLLFQLLEVNQNKDIYMGLVPYHTPAREEMVLFQQLKEIGIKRIQRCALEHVEHLGSGQFGSVEKAVWKWGRVRVDVALKTLNSESVSEQERIKFLQEAVLMAQFKHPNIISLYGVVSSGEPVVLVMELAGRGDLLRVLKTLRPTPGEMVPHGLRDTLLVYSQQIALGMQYLSSKHFIHRDLACRNVLVTGENICKIADFGLSRHLNDEDYYFSEGGKIPVKWTAPEATRHRKYSTASDVWSYGCLLYEIWSLGTKPFANKTNVETMLLIADGYRLHSPPGCPKKIYKLMLMCWREKASERPVFRDITNALGQDGIFHIPSRELETHSQAGVLGADLEAGTQLYKNLRDRFLTAQ